MFFHPRRRLLPLFSALLVAGIVALSEGMTLRAPQPGYKNELGVGVSYGVKLDKDAAFWGYAPDYTRTFAGKWILNLSMAYDEETERRNGPDSVSESWTPSAILGVQLSPRWAAGLGVGHGVWEKKNDGDWETIGWGKDVSFALAAAVGLWNRGQHGLSLSMSYEYQVNDEASSISGDLGYSYSF